MFRSPHSLALVALFLLPACGAGTGSGPAATPEPQAHEAAELTRNVLETQRSAIVANAMELTEQESQAFWPVYRAYRARVDRLDERLARLVEQYMQDPVNIGSREAEDMLAELLEIRSARLELKKQYVKEFRKALPSIKLVRYYQVENKLDAAAELELARAIPLIW